MGRRFNGKYEFIDWFGTKFIKKYRIIIKTNRGALKLRKIKNSINSLGKSIFQGGSNKGPDKIAMTNRRITQFKNKKIKINCGLDLIFFIKNPTTKVYVYYAYFNNSIVIIEPISFDDDNVSF